MPARIKTRCNQPGCPRAVRGRFCDEHARSVPSPAERRRPTAPERGYDSRWRKLRTWYIKRHPLCEDCWDEEGVVNARDIEVDHIIPIKVRPDLRLEATNLRSRCRSHHQRKTNADKRRYGTRRAIRHKTPM
jgi:5-methylcytosine-specific restriction protein A